MEQIDLLDVQQLGQLATAYWMIASLADASSNVAEYLTVSEVEPAELARRIDGAIESIPVRHRQELLNVYTALEAARSRGATSALRMFGLDAEAKATLISEELAKRPRSPVKLLESMFPDDAMPVQGEFRQLALNSLERFLTPAGYRLASARRPNWLGVDAILDAGPSFPPIVIEVKARVHARTIPRAIEQLARAQNALGNQAIGVLLISSASRFASEVLAERQVAARYQLASDTIQAEDLVYLLRQSGLDLSDEGT